MISSEFGPSPFEGSWLTVVTFYGISLLALDANLLFADSSSGRLSRSRGD